jgi:UDP-N-acetylmuramate dehydrogenase
MKDGFIADLKASGAEFRADYAIKGRTTFNIGGRVECYLKVKNITELASVLKAAKAAKKQIFAMGSLSNVLITDKKIKKIFIELGGGLASVKVSGKNSVHAGAGAKISVLLGALLKSGLTGLEFMAGIPGTVGGAVYMNAGAFGKGIGSYIKKVYYMDENGRCGVMANAKKAFTYRHSVFQDNGFIITGVELGLKKGNKTAIKKEMAALIKTRHSRHPWNAYCAGSFFKNGKDFTAGKLIEEAGLKGKKAGGAQISKMHANFLINTGSAKFDDVIKLDNIVKREVFRKFGVKLEEEVRIIK